jgi:hypothetical protein
MTLTGGASAKVGIRYEFYWTVLHLLDILKGNYDTIRLEPPGEPGEGIEFYLRSGDKYFFHQVKRQNGIRGKWSISDLERAGVISSFQKRLLDRKGRCVFVSMDPVGDLRELTYRAERSSTLNEFLDVFVSPGEHARNIKRLRDSLQTCSCESVYFFLKHVRFDTIGEPLLKRLVNETAAQMFTDATKAISTLLHFVMQSEHLELSKDVIAKYLLSEGDSYVPRVSLVYNECSATGDELRRYLFDLISRLEERKGFAEYLELSVKSESAGGEADCNNVRETIWEPEFSLLVNGKKAEPSETARTRRKLSSIDEAVSDFDSFALIGEPGGGKSTTLRRLCLDTARKCLASGGMTPIPLLLNLPSWKEDNEPGVFVAKWWPFRSDPAPLIENGRIKLYLDGLNEMGNAGEAKAKQLRSWIHGNRNRDENIRSTRKPRFVIVTCRKRDYVNLFNLDLPTVEVEPLSDVQVAEFVTNYLPQSGYKLLNRIMPGSQTTWKYERPLYGLSRNPYFLAILIYLFQESPDGELPKNMGALFKKLVEVLWDRERRRGTHNRDGVAYVQRALARLAFAMVDGSLSTTVSLQYALFFLADDELLRLSHSSSMLIVGDGTVQFYHQLMLEYFAAVGLREVGIDYIRIIQRRFSSSTTHQLSDQQNPSSKWTEVAIALCGIVETPEETIKEIAAIDPLLAEKCLTSDIGVDRQSITPILLAVLNDGDARVRVAAVRVLASAAADEEVVQGLAGALFDTERDVREHAVNALGKVGNSSFPILLAKLAKS